MREEWWLEQVGDEWWIVGYPSAFATQSRELRRASAEEVTLWNRWKSADRQVAILTDRLASLPPPPQEPAGK